MSNKVRPLPKAALALLKLLEDKPHTRKELIINMNIPLKSIVAALKILERRKLIVKKPNIGNDMRTVIYQLDSVALFPFPDLLNTS